MGYDQLNSGMTHIDQTMTEWNWTSGDALKSHVKTSHQLDNTTVLFLNYISSFDSIADIQLI